MQTQQRLIYTQRDAPERRVLSSTLLAFLDSNYVFNDDTIDRGFQNMVSLALFDQASGFLSDGSIRIQIVVKLGPKNLFRYPGQVSFSFTKHVAS
jgi:hypothetical protein